ncbi:GNAT family N-acetyltransferase [Ideonella sp. A 288]|uniref:GNAT family N-acetyltransferase n=1 Tax=Ideonella sp. A 288 TaxID=1962181 RepID=UPI000B4B3CAF|nr:GNAT family N-acetyltransferase [Ideonella sp. A 288]
MQLVPIEQTGTALSSALTAGSVAADVVAATVALYARRGYEVPWIGYLAKEGSEYIGGCGFAGPASRGEAEIAYYTFPGHEGRGVATEMAGELLRISRQAATEADVRFIAHTLPEEGASTSVLRKLGFVLQGVILHPEDGKVWKWSESERSEA